MVDMTKNEWQKSIDTKIYFMAKQVWSGLTTTKIDAFVHNFSDNKDVGWALLEMLIYYSHEQEQKLAEYVFKKFKRHLWINEINKGDSSQIIEILNKKLEKTCFIPLETEVDGSAFSLSSLYKKLDSFPKCVEFHKVEDIPLLLALKKSHIVFFDDIIGTGTQFNDFWSVKNHFNLNITLDKLADINVDSHFYYLVFGAYESSLVTLQNRFKNITILAAERFTEYNSVYNTQNEYWDLRPFLQDEVINYISEKVIELGINNPYGLDIPILYQHCRAQNTSFPLYWFKEEHKWKELYKR